MEKSLITQLVPDLELNAMAYVMGYTSVVASVIHCRQWSN